MYFRSDRAQAIMTKHKSNVVVALVGRPNVGKSTLFNWMVGSRKALVENTPGLTRDRNYAVVTIRDRTFTVVDTGGFEPTTDDVILAQMRTQTLFAIEEADLIVFLGDAKVGLTPSDREIVRTLAQCNKPVFYAVNKVDSEKHEDLAVDFYALGLETVYPLSARTGFGSDDLLEALFEHIAPDPPDPETDEETPAAEAYTPNRGRRTPKRGKIDPHQPAARRRAAQWLTPNPAQPEIRSTQW